MRNHTYLKLITLCCFFGCTLGLSAQNGIGLFSRHLLNPNGEVAIGVSDRSALAFLGAGLEYRLDRETHKLYSFIIGISIQENLGTGFNTPPGVFLQANWRLFKPLINTEKLQGFSSIGPRLFYLSRSFDPLDGSNSFPTSTNRGGVEVQAAFNLDYRLSDNFTLTSFVNVLSFASSVNSSVVENPILTPRQRRNGGFDFDGRIFNELRIGLMYTLEN